MFKNSLFLGVVVVFRGSAVVSMMQSGAQTRVSVATSAEGGATGRLKSTAGRVSRRKSELHAAKSLLSVRSPAVSRSGKPLLPSSSGRPSWEAGSDAQNNPYHAFIMQHIATMLMADEDDDDQRLFPDDSAEPISNSLCQPLPNPRLRLSLMHTSSMNSGVRVVSSDQLATASPSWDNLGEVYFRGTLRDLDTTYLEVRHRTLAQRGLAKNRADRNICIQHFSAWLPLLEAASRGVEQLRVY